MLLCFCICFRDEIFDSPAAGASPDVTKVLILITDGDPSDIDRNGIIKRYDDKNIIRLVIGVGCDVLHQSQQKNNIYPLDK